MKYLMLCCLVFLFSPGFAQQDTLHQKKKFYYGLGIGFGPGSESGGYADVYLYLQRKTNYLALKSSVMSEFQIYSYEPAPGVSDLALILGKSYTFNQYVNVQFGLGPAYTERIYRGAFLYNTCNSFFCLFGRDVYEIVKQRALGLSAETKFNFMVSSRWVLTLGLNANLNQAKSFCGACVGLRYGRLRDRIAKN
ncbi:hypothetical protein DBR40_03000 [Pedobacter sp. KBW01]|uniref:hypothetical protein n=1 Tax=Pedobacter sp. KBW01 TaxID=2153364 RepID=UPI000F5A2944|nr:hypothetical protein [Pedobacter sp. KBW01]RQO79344.1 hypothetical protein DBR40_03000 [Pedobacter sp. KBW01]